MIFLKVDVSIMNNLKGKNILFFTAAFMGFQYDIIEGLEALGAHVDWYDERISDSTATKILVRLNRDLLFRKINNYYNVILQKIKDKSYDYVFFVNIEAATSSIIKKIRESQPDAKFILYEWDSIKNNLNAINNIKMFDSVWTFDRKDSIEYGISFLPLFYLDKYSQLKKKDVYESKLLFVGTTHSDRYYFVKSIEKQVCKNGDKSFLWFYFPSKLLYYKMWLTDENFRNSSSIHDFKFETLRQKDLLRMVESSEIVVDAQHPAQIGLTMRTIETLGARRKLITTNKDIVNYDFYNPVNILVVDRKNPVVPESFLSESYCDLSDTIYEKYSLTSWLKTLFAIN